MNHLLLIMSILMSYTAYTDEQLVLLIANDDTNAFKLLYNRYWKKMLTQAYAKLQSDVLAEEIVQDCFINLWKRRHNIKLKYSFHTYISAALRYEVLAQLAQNNKLPHSSVDIETVVIQDYATQQWLDFDDLRHQFENALTALPEKCQLVFRLSRESGFTDKQISENLSISHKTVEAHISKALKILRLTLGNFLILLLSAGFVV